MSWLSDRLKEAVPYAMMALPFTPWGAALKGMQPQFMQGIMRSKFMNSILGAGLKDAGLKYALAAAQGKKNPHLIAKDALLRGMFTNAYKVGFDPSMMMGGGPTIPDPIMEDKTFTIPGGTTFDPAGNVMPKVSYMPDSYSALDQASSIRPDIDGVLREQSLPFLRDDYKGMSINNNINLAALEDQISAIKPLNMVTDPDESFTKEGMITNFGDIIEARSEKNPLAGMGYMTTTKTKPSMLDRLLGKVKEAKELGIERGSDEWDEMFDIGATRPDSAWLAGTMYDYLRDPWTDAQIKQKEKEDYEDFMQRLMYPRSMDDVPDFQSAFLGNKGGIASLSNGGMGPGPYSNPYPDDDSNIDVQDIIQGPGFESIDELGALFGDPDEMAMSQPHPMEGWYDMFFDTFGRYPKNEAELIQFINEADVDLQQTGRSIGPAGASTVSEDGTRMMAKDGLWANIHAKRKRIAGGSGETMRSPGSAGAPTDKALRESQASGGIMGYYGGGELDAISGGMMPDGPGTEKSDSIPARLSDNEFVFTANAVRAAGGGNVDLGAQKLYGIMNALDPSSAKPNDPPVYS